MIIQQWSQQALNTKKEIKTWENECRKTYIISILVQVINILHLSFWESRYGYVPSLHSLHYQLSILAPIHDDETGQVCLKIEMYADYWKKVEHLTSSELSQMITPQRGGEIIITNNSLGHLHIDYSFTYYLFNPTSFQQIISKNC